MIVKIYIFSPLYVMAVLSITLDKEFRSNCTFGVKFDYDKDENNLPNVSCFRTCDKDSQEVQQVSKDQSFYYHDREVEKKYDRMVEITVSPDGTLKCSMIPTNSTKEMYLIPEKLVSKSMATCPEHYDYVKEIETCLKFSDTELKWNQADKACIADGGTLVIVDSEEKQKAFNSAAGSLLVPRLTTPIDKYGLLLWIGLSDIKTEGKFQWVDGSPLNYSRWFDKEPNNVKNNEDCVHIAFLNNISLWNDRPCDGKARYVCEMRPIHIIKEKTTTSHFSTTLTPSTTVSPITLTPSTNFSSITASSGTLEIQICPSGWWKSNVSDTCYYIGEDGRTFDQSVHYCNGIGGTIASIDNSFEMQYIQGLMENNEIISIWVGLSDKSLDGSFQWVDGTPLNYTSWGANQPDDWKNNEDCVAIDQTWKYLWIDMACDITVQQLCQRSPEKIAIKDCSSGNIVARQVGEDFLLDDLICPNPTTPSTPSLMCIQEDGSVGTIDHQYLAPLVVVSALLGLHFLGFILVSYYFCKFYKKHKRHVRNAKIAQNHSGNPKNGETNMAHYCTPKIMKVPPVPAPLALREGDEDRYSGENNIYDGPEYDTEKYGYYINPHLRVK